MNGHLQLEQIVNSFFSSNTYILSEENEYSVWLVDCGDAMPAIRWCETNEKKVAGVFLTHTHFDHIYGLNDLLVHNPQLKVYTSENGSVSLKSPRFNMSLFHEHPFIYEGEVDVLHEGDNVKLYSDMELHVFDTPGHDWSCLSYRIGEHLFTGDSYIPGMKVVTNFPKSNKQQAQESLNRILQMVESCRYICPGHEKIREVKI